MPIATNELIKRSQAVKAIADQILDRTSYVIITPTDNLTPLVDNLAEHAAKWSAYLDNGTAAVLCTSNAEIVRVVDILIGTAAVITVPKTVPAKAISAALGQRVPDDGSQDLVVLHAPGEPMFWPLLFVDALDLVDPKVAAELRANQLRNLN